MFDDFLAILTQIMYINCKEKNKSSGVEGAVHMDNDRYKKLIIEMVNNVSDRSLLIRIYTYIKYLLE